MTQHEWWLFWLLITVGFLALAVGWWWREWVSSTYWGGVAGACAWMAAVVIALTVWEARENDTHGR